MAERSRRFGAAVAFGAALLLAGGGGAQAQEGGGTAALGGAEDTLDPDLLKPIPEARSEATDEARARYVLRRTVEGGYLYEGAAFNAYIEPDGEVRFMPPSPLIPAGPDHVFAVGPAPIVGNDLRGLWPVYPPLVVESMPGVRFDFTDEYMRRVGHQDPARYEKGRFLAATFEQRTKMAEASRDQVEDAALADLPGRLDQIWRDPQRTSAERKTILRALWTELGEDESADRARTVMRGFARAHLSPEEAAAYE